MKRNITKRNKMNPEMKEARDERIVNFFGKRKEKTCKGLLHGNNSIKPPNQIPQSFNILVELDSIDG